MSSILKNLWMKITNSVVGVGLYYGFLTTLSLGPSYLFLARAQLMEEGTENKVAAITGFLLGQFVVFGSIFSTPLHLALGRPHTIIAIVVLYHCFDFFCNNFVDYGSTTRNSLPNFSSQYVFVENTITQVFNHVALPSPIFARLVYIYMFRCNNKMLFLISSFVGWLIGQIFFLKILQLALVWIQQNSKNFPSSIRKFLVPKPKRKRRRPYVAHPTVTSLLLFCVYYFDIAPTPFFRKQLKEPRKQKESEEEVESEEERDVEIKKTSEMKGIKQEQEGSTEEDPSSSLNRNANQENQEIKFVFTQFTKNSLLSLFDYNRWNRPLRYISNDQNEMVVRTEMSQYFFHICESDGKEKMAFTYPPSLSIFLQMLKKRVWGSTIGKTLSNDNEFDNYWIYSNNRKGNKTSKEFRNRIEALDKKSLFLDILETRTRLCNDSNDDSENNDDSKNKNDSENNDDSEDSENEYFYFPKAYDPFLSGPYRLTMTTEISPSNESIEDSNKSIEDSNKSIEDSNESIEDSNKSIEDSNESIEDSNKSIEDSNKSIEDLIKSFDINRIYTILFADPDYPEFERQTDAFDKKPSLIEMENFSTLTGEFDRQLKLTKGKKRFLNFFLNAIQTDTTNPTESIKESNPMESIKESNPTESIEGSESIEEIEIQEISKTVPQWPGDLISEIDKEYEAYNAQFQSLKDFYTEDFELKFNNDNNNDNDDDDDNDTESEGEPESERQGFEIRSRLFKIETLFVPLDESENVNKNQNANKNANVNANENPNVNANQNANENENQNEKKKKNANENENENVNENKNVNAKKTEKKDEGEYEDDFKGTARIKTKPGFLPLPWLRYVNEPDFRRDLIKGSVRPQRRKTGIWKLYQANPHSPLFVDRLKGPFDDIFESLKVVFRNRTDKEMIEFEIVEDIAEKDKKITEEETRLVVAQGWENVPSGHLIRGSLLISQSILRKYIILPSLIIAKNIGRMLLFQFPEWFEDIEEWNQETHVKCSNDGVQISETELPDEWWEDGIQIKILYPFSLKPWHKSKLESKLGPSDINLMKKKKQKKDFCFLTAWGQQTDLPFGAPRIRRVNSFFEPIFKELQEKIRKLKSLARILTKLILEKFNPIFSLIKVSESNEIKNEKDSRISNQIIDESFSLFQSQNWKNYSLTKKKDLTGRTNTIRNQIERITKEKKKITASGVYINPTEKGYLAKRLESTTNIWQILKRRNVRLISQLDCFLKIFLEKIYIDIVLSIINISRLNIQFLLEWIKKMTDKPINETNQERLNRKNQNIINFISTLPINSLRNSQNLHSFCDLSYFSQAYVFFKLSQSRVSNKLRSFFQYHGMSFFIKAEIKDYFETQGILHSKLSHNKLPNSEMNEWKNWLLMGHSSRIKWYKLILQKLRNRVNLRHKNQNSKWDSDEKVQSKKGSNSRNSYLLNQKEKDNLNFEKTSKYDLLSYKSINLNYENKRDSSISKSSSQVQLKKNKDIFYKRNTHKYNMSDISIWRSIPTKNFLDIEYFNFRYAQSNPDRKYLDREKLVLDFSYEIRMESFIELDRTINKNTQIDTNYYEIIQKFDKKELVYLTPAQKFQSQKPRKNWLGLNKEILNCTVSHLGSWFFPEFVLPYNLYQAKPWVIPSETLMLNLNPNENALSENSEKKNIEENQKEKGESVSNKKEKGESVSNKKEKGESVSNKKIKGESVSNKKEKGESVSTKKEKGESVSNKKEKGESVSNKKIKNQKDQKDKKDKKKKESVESKRDLTSKVQKQGNAKSVPSTKDENDIKDPLVRKKKKKKLTRFEKETMVLFEKRFLVAQLLGNNTWTEQAINNINVGAMLATRQNKIRTLAISSMKRGEFNVDILSADINQPFFQRVKERILDFVPTRLSVTNDGEFIMYQTLGISLAHKIKHQINQGSRKQPYFDKNGFDLLVPETILSHRRRRELRILLSLNSKTWNKNPIFWTENNCSQSLDLDKENHLNLNKDKNELMKFKFFLWPNYRLEDLACMNRYWFNTNNGSRFSMLRIRMYPRLKNR